MSRSPRYALPDHLCRFGVRAADPLARGFSRQPRITHFAQMGSASGLRLHARRICLPCVLHRYPGTTIARDGLPSCVTPSLAYDQPPPTPATTASSEELAAARAQAGLGSALARTHRYGTINPLSIDYACRPRLRSRLTQGGTAWPWNPWSSGGEDSHFPCATHACILTRATSTTPSQGGFTGGATLPYPPPPLNPLAGTRDHAGVPRLRRCA